MHVVLLVGDHERDRRELVVVGRKIGKAQIRRGLDCRPVRHVGEADPRHVLAAIAAGIMAAGRRHIDLRPDRRQPLGIALEGQPSGEERRAEIAAREFDPRDLVVEANTLIVAREEPEIIALAVVLLAEHARQQRPFGRQPIEVRCGRVADDLAEILVLLDDDDDVVVARQTPRPNRRRPDHRRRGNRDRRRWRRLAAPEQREKQQREEGCLTVHQTHGSPPCQ